jgi:septal ring factor EnvC (AmiA/AmiB activator)
MPEPYLAAGELISAVGPEGGGGEPRVYLWSFQKF